MLGDCPDVGGKGATMATKADKKDLKMFHTKAKKIVESIARERDALRGLIAEYNDVLDDTEMAVDTFENALDTLSQLL